MNTCLIELSPVSRLTQSRRQRDRWRSASPQQAPARTRRDVIRILAGSDGTRLPSPPIRRRIR